MNDGYLQRRPMIFTTNKPMEEWGKVLHDPDLAEAILDRVLERGRILHFKGPSYRTRHLQPDGVPIISRKGPPEFRELTRGAGTGPHRTRTPLSTPCRAASGPDRVRHGIAIPRRGVPRGGRE